MSSSFSDQTPLSQIRTQLDLAETYACQSGRQPGCPGLAPEEENQVFTRLRQQLTDRNKLIQVGLLDRYRNICAESSSRCPPLPITGIKACLYIMKMIKPGTEHAQIDRLAEVFETWRVMLVVEVGELIAGTDSIWSCTALRQLVDKPPPPTHTQPSAPGPASPCAPPTPPTPPLPTPGPSGLPRASPALPIALGPAHNRLNSTQQESLAGPSQIKIPNPHTISHIPATASTLLPRPTPNPTPVPPRENSTPAEPNLAQSTQDALPSTSSAKRPLNQPAGASGALPVEITDWIAAIRLMDDALTDYLNQRTMPPYHAVNAVSPYHPRLVSPNCSSLKHISIPAPLTILSPYNPMLVLSAPQAFGLSRLEFNPDVTFRPFPGILSKSSSTATPSMSPANQSKHLQPTLAASNTHHVVDNTAQPQSPVPEPYVCPSPPAISDDPPPRLSVTTLEDTETPCSTSVSAPQNRPASVSLPTTSSEASQLSAQCDPPPPDAAFPERPPTTSMLDPPIAPIPPTSNLPMVFTPEQRVKLVNLIKGSSIEHRKKMALAFKNKGIEEFFRFLPSPPLETGSLPESNLQTLPVASTSPSLELELCGSSTPAPLLIKPTALQHSPSVQASATSTFFVPPVTQNSQPVGGIASTSQIPISAPSTSQDPQTSNSTRNPTPKQTSQTPGSSTLPKHQLDPQITTMVQAMLCNGPQPLVTIMIAFAQLNISSKEVIRAHLQALAKPLSQDPHGPWVLKSQPPIAVGSVASQAAANGVVESQSRVETHQLDSSNQKKPPAPSLLISALQTGFPMPHSATLSANTSSINANGGSEKCSDQLGSLPVDRINTIQEPDETILQPQLIQVVSRKRVLHSDEEVDPTDTLTDTTQGSNGIVRVEKESVDQVTTDSLRLTEKVFKRRLFLKPDVQYEMRNSSTRSTRKNESSSCSQKRSISPPALQNDLGPFVDDLPGFPVVDPKIQIIGTRARIFEKFEVDQQMPPLRTFVPLCSGKIYRRACYR